MEKLEFTGTFCGIITKCFEPRGGVSARTGNAWKSQQFKLEEYGVQYPHRIVFEIYGEDNLNKFNIQEGGKYEVSLNFSTSEYNGKEYNQIRAWNVAPIADVQESVAVPTPKNNVPQQGQAEEKNDPFAPAEGEDENGGLPF